MIANPVTPPLSDYKAQHVRLAVDGKIATLTLNQSNSSCCQALELPPITRTRGVPELMR